MDDARFERGRLLLGDCLDLLPSLPDESAQLIIADPPYNLGPKFSGTRQWQHDPQWVDWCRAWLTECARILRQDGNLFVYGIHHYACYLQVEMYRLGLRYRRQIIWHYENGFSASKRTLATHYEPILWFSKSDSYFFREIREPYKSADRLRHPIKKNGKTWAPHPDGRLAGDVWRFPVLAGRRFRDERVAHPTQKPLNLTERIVGHFSEPDQLVVVPFAGSGTECVAAANLQRRFWATEISREYFDLAASRLRGEPEETGRESGAI